MKASASVDPRAGRPTKGRYGWVKIVVLIVVASVAVASVAMTVVWFSTATTVAEKELTVRLSNGSAAARISLPTGWSWRAQFGDASRGVAGSPDRVMTVDFALIVDAGAVAALEEAAAAPLGPLNEEPVSGAARLLSARTVEPGTIAGAISEGSAVVTFVSTPSPEYDAELATLLTGVELMP